MRSFLSALVTATMAVLLTFASVTLVLGPAPTRTFALQDNQDDQDSPSDDQNDDSDRLPDDVTKLGAQRTIRLLPPARHGRSAPPVLAAVVAASAAPHAPAHLQLSVRRLL